MFDKIKFGNAIKNLCKMNNITAYRLAQELNVSEDYLYKIQNGKNQNAYPQNNGNDEDKSLCNISSHNSAPLISLDSPEISW